jgi:hypothetical protein
LKITTTILLAALAMSPAAASAGMLELAADLNTPSRVTHSFYSDTEYAAHARLSMRLAILSRNFRDGEATWRWGLGVGVQRLTLKDKAGYVFDRDYRATSLEASFDRKVWRSSDFCLTVGAGGSLVFMTRNNSSCSEPFCSLGDGSWAAFVISRAEFAVSGRVALVAGLRSWLWSPEAPFKAAPVLSLGIQVD